MISLPPVCVPAVSVIVYLHPFWNLRLPMHLSCALENDILGPFPEAQLSQRPEVLVTLGDRHEVVRGQLAKFALEHGAVVREQDLRLGVAAGVEQDLPGLGHARRVLPRNPEVVVPQGYPARLPAPADVDDFLPVGQQLLERLDGPRTPLPLPAGQKPVGAGGYLDVAHDLTPLWLASDALRSSASPGLTSLPTGPATILPSRETVVPRTRVRTTLPWKARPTYGLTLWR